MNSSKDELKCAGAFQSRFKIVKIESKKTLRRGRWICRDFSDPLAARNSDEPVAGVYCMPGSYEAWNQPFIATIVYSDGQPTLESGAVTVEGGQAVLEPYASLTIKGDNCVVCISDLQSDLLAICDDTNSLNKEAKVPMKHCRLLSSDNLAAMDVDMQSAMCIDDGQPLSTVLGGTLRFVVGPHDPDHDLVDSNSALFAIDSKIEQAMDLLKSHLMFAVHQEVQLLKERIAELTMKNSKLEYENRLMREAALPDTTSRLVKKS